VDIDAQVISTINSGKIHIEEPGLHTLVRAAIQSGHLRAAQHAEAADVYIIAVPTGLAEGKKPDLQHVDSAAESIAKVLKQGSLVILESTVPPGTCRDRLVPILEKSGLRAGRDFALAHCPERVLPGHILKELIENDRIVGGYTPDCAEKAAALYSRFVEGAIHRTDCTTAEFVKVIENTFRDVNIALANEAALLCEKLDINFLEASTLANRHPRVNILRAGPGVGGHCISVDPWFLVDAFPGDTELIRLARTRNDAMPAHVIQQTLALLEDIANPKVAVLGLAFKGNVDDTRETPALPIIKGLREAAVEVNIHDPLVQKSPLELSSFEACVKGADCLLILCDHEEYKSLEPAELAALMRGRILYDTRHILAHAAWQAAGFKVRVLGTGSE
jgi:UDP-N-acetyl-D-mannosaminuronic acid dehydrogenase